MSLSIQVIIDDARRFQHFGEYETAIEWLNKAFELDYLTTREMIEIEKLLCFSYRKLEEHDLALIHINKAICILRESDDIAITDFKRELGICYMNKGAIFQELDDYPTSFKCCLDALNIFEELYKKREIDDGIMINAYITLASLCYDHDDYSNVKYYLRKSLILFDKMGTAKNNDLRYQSVMNTLNELEIM